MNGSGRVGDRGSRRKPFNRRDHDNQSQNRDSPKNVKKTAGLPLEGNVRFEKKRGGFVERPKWSPPKQPELSLPAVSCAWCGKPIKEISMAISDPVSGKPVHFDCALNRIVEEQTLERGDTVSYIGGGRFGIIHYNNPPDIRDFTIKKILELENRENRAQWRVTISDYFTVT
jgi:hypothetical protein